MKKIKKFKSIQDEYSINFKENSMKEISSIMADKPILSGTKPVLSLPVISGKFGKLEV